MQIEYCLSHRKGKLVINSPSFKVGIDIFRLMNTFEKKKTNQKTKQRKTIKSHSVYSFFFFSPLSVFSVQVICMCCVHLVVFAEIRTEAVMQALAAHSKKIPVMPLPSKRTSVNYHGQQRHRDSRQGLYFSPRSLYPHSSCKQPPLCQSPFQSSSQLVPQHPQRSFSLYLSLFGE